MKYSFDSGDFKVWHCLSCLWLYVFDGQGFVRKEEVARDVVGQHSRTTTPHYIDQSLIVRDRIRIEIAEEKDQTTFLEELALREDAVLLKPVSIKRTSGPVGLDLKHSVALRKGEYIEAEFDVTPCWANEDESVWR